LSRRLAYLVGRYPAVSHTFITREVLGLRARGLDLDTYSIWRTAEDELLSPTDHEEAARTHVVLPPSQPWVMAGQAAAVRASASAYAQLGRRALELAPRGARGKLLASSWTIEAAALWHACHETGVRHIHAHLNGTGPTVALLAASFGNALDGPGTWTWSMTVHGPAEFYDVEGEALPAKTREATFVACISDFARSQLMAFVDEDEWSKLHIVHCGVDPLAFAPVDRGIRSGRTQILCVGRLTRIKGQAVLLDAVARLRERGVDVEVTLIGDGPKRADLEGMVERLRLGDRVTLAGSVGQDAIRPYFDRADLFALTSFAEGVPVVLMEAMACELPVIAPQVMGVGELVRDGVNGRLLPPGRADLVAAAIEELARDPERRRALGAEGRATVQREFDISSSVAELATLFDRYAASPRR
jgi:colanic acid/amylovoran biosynthesis glycosyltransferase